MLTNYNKTISKYSSEKVCKPVIEGEDKDKGEEGCGLLDSGVTAIKV